MRTIPVPMADTLTAMSGGGPGENFLIMRTDTLGNMPDTNQGPVERSTRPRLTAYWMNRAEVLLPIRPIMSCL